MLLRRNDCIIFALYRQTSGCPKNKNRRRNKIRYAPQQDQRNNDAFRFRSLSGVVVSAARVGIVLAVAELLLKEKLKQRNAF